MTCDHKRWVYPDLFEHEMTGEAVYPTPYQESTWGDKVAGDGRFECTQCGQVGYYTGSWRKFWEEGVPCSGSEGFTR